MEPTKKRARVRNQFRNSLRVSKFFSSGCILLFGLHATRGVREPGDAGARPLDRADEAGAAACAGSKPLERRACRILVALPVAAGAGVRATARAAAAAVARGKGAAKGKAKGAVARGRRLQRDPAKEAARACASKVRSILFRSQLDIVGKGAFSRGHKTRVI